MRQFGAFLDSGQTESSQSLVQAIFATDARARESLRISAVHWYWNFCHSILPRLETERSDIAYPSLIIISICRRFLNHWSSRGIDT